MAIKFIVKYVCSGQNDKPQYEKVAQKCSICYSMTRCWSIGDWHNTEKGNSMMTVQVRKQGGAAVMTIPADILNVLDLHVGSRLQILPQVDGFSVRAVAEPAPSSVSKRLSLQELLRGATAGNMEKLRLQSIGALDGAPVGHELI